MAHLLYDYKYLFGGDSALKPLSPLQIIALTIGNEIYADKFLPIKWGQSNDQLEKSIIISVIKMDNIDVLDYLCSVGYSLRKLHIFFATRFGSLKCLQYIHKQGCELTTIDCKIAAVNGHLNCLRYLHEQDCP